MDSDLSEGANAIVEIIEFRWRRRALSTQARRFKSVDGDILADYVRNRSTPLSEKIDVGLMLSHRLAQEAAAEDDARLFRDSLKQLFFATFLLIRMRDLGNGGQAAALYIAKTLGDGIRKSDAVRQDLKRREESLQNAAPSFRSIFPPDFGKDRFDELAASIRRATNKQSPIKIPGHTLTSAEPTAADLLVRAVKKLSDQPSKIGVSGKLSAVRISKVQLSGFRGAPHELTVSLSTKSGAASAIIFGENGSGKSTIVDAIEFALQGRVGRSANFTSALQPSLLSLSSPTSRAQAVVNLDDESEVRRQVRVMDDARVVADPNGVRAEFRLAPITIKRSDILRFLDMEALERGTTLLDYFPADASGLGMRPEEEVHQLNGEMAELRIKRSAYAEELSALIGVDKHTLANAGLLNQAVQETIMQGQRQKQFEDAGGWDAVDPEIRDAIGRLSRVHRRLKEIKTRIQRTGEILNPVPYREQAETLGTIISGVSTELSEAFRAVATEHPVQQISVVFAESGPLSLDIVVELDDGSTCFPQQLFSEAYRDLLALLFFVAVARKASERGQAKILILDDVLQSIDSKVRHAFVRYLLENLPDWQLIFTVHDRLWRDQLRDLFSAYDHASTLLSIDSWTFEAGPRLTKAGIDSVDRDLRSALRFGAEPRTVAILAGQILELVCSQLSWRLRLRVIRREDDRYTLGDLWPVVSEYLQTTNARRDTVSVAAHLKMRNLTAHATNDSMLLTTAEAHNYANAVLELLSAVRCNECRSWVGGSAASCSCGQVRLNVNR